jgi:hypothetical protein
MSVASIPSINELKYFFTDEEQWLKFIIVSVSNLALIKSERLEGPLTREGARRDAAIAYYIWRVRVKVRADT